MKQINKKVLLATSLLTLVPMGFGLLFWDRLPDQLATHLRLTGEVNGTTDKTWFVVGLPLVFLGCYVMMSIVIDRLLSANQPLFSKMKWASAGLMAFVPSILIAYNLGWFSDIRKLVLVGIALAWLVIGNYGHKQAVLTIPRQALHTRKVRQLTSYFFVGMALLVLVSLAFPVAVSFWVLWFATGFMVLWSLVSSLYLAIKQQKSEA